MFTNKSPQLNVRQSKLLAIAATVTDRFFYQESTSLHLSQVKDYHVWRDCTQVAIVNSKTFQLIVLGRFSSKPKGKEIVIQEQDITPQGLVQKMQQYYGQLLVATCIKEINSAWQFFRPLDPTFSKLHQAQSAKPKDYSLKIATPKKANIFKKLGKITFPLNILSPSSINL